MTLEADPYAIEFDDGADSLCATYLSFMPEGTKVIWVAMCQKTIDDIVKIEYGEKRPSWLRTLYARLRGWKITQKFKRPE